MPDINPIEDGQRQSNPLETTASGSPRRPRRELPKFPETPIQIPPERTKKAKELLKSISDLWGQGEHYKSLVKWFDLPQESRDDIINTTLLQEANPRDRSLRSAQYDTEGKPENLILRHYALLSTPEVGKIIHPNEDNPITSNDVLRIFSNPGAASGEHSFRFKIMSLGLRQNPYFHDMDDFTKPNEDIKRNFSIEEAGEFLLELIPHVKDDIKDQLLSSWGVISSIKHADLLTDPRLADDLEKSLIGEISWASRVENYLSQGVFPSPEFFEEAFKRLKPEYVDPNANLQISLKEANDTSVPASVFYFTMLRRITTLEKARGMDLEFTKDREDRIVSYLLNDAFITRALPYLDTEDVYQDNFISEGYGQIMYNAKIEATGQEAKDIKSKRFGEILGAAETYLKQKGGTDTLQKLKDREIAGVKFSDYWPKDSAT